MRFLPFRFVRHLAWSTAVFLLWSSTASASDISAVPHITDFNLGLNRQEVALRPVKECGDRLCGEVSFGGKVWNAVFTLEDDVLKAISLSAPTDAGYMKAALDGFAESPYVIDSAISDAAAFRATGATGATGTTPAGSRADDFAGFLQKTVQASSSFASFYYVEKDAVNGKRDEASGGSLVLTPAGLNVLIMNAGDLEQEIHSRMMRIQVAGERSR